MAKRPIDNTESFRKALTEGLEWPNEYMFKFVVPADPRKEGKIIELFPDDADVSFRSSRTGKYTGITIKSWMQSPEDVIRLYEQVRKLGGVMAL